MPANVASEGGSLANSSLLRTSDNRCYVRFGMRESREISGCVNPGKYAISRISPALGIGTMPANSCATDDGELVAAVLLGL